MRRLTTWCLVLGCALSLTFTGCDSGDDAGDGTTETNETGADDSELDEAAGANEGEVDGASSSATDEEETEGWSALGSISDMTPMEVPADCGFDPELEGTGKNFHITNMQFYGLELEDGTREKYKLHYDCGGESKAVWIFLSTGWCGACNSYARTVEKVYNAYKDQGLRVLWIVGEGDITDGEKPPITKESFAQYFAAHAPMSFTVVRDPSFNATYSQLDNTEPSLPHQYLLDGSTMELTYFQGGTKAEGLQAVAEMIDVDYAEIEAMLAN
ncbi:MAG: TlpA family protein disulfide reductase [Myxococcota bacterium]